MKITKCKKLLTLIIPLIMILSFMFVASISASPTIVKITYDANGGINPPAVKQLYPNSYTQITTAKPTLDGYTFRGWTEVRSITYVQPDYLPGDWYFIADSDVTLYAVWRKTFFTITYDSNGGQPIPPNKQLYADTYTQVTTTKPAISGATFLGWNTYPNPTVRYQPGDWIFVDDDITLKAVWSTDEWDKWCTVYFNYTELSDGEFWKDTTGGSVWWQQDIYYGNSISNHLYLGVPIGDLNDGNNKLEIGGITWVAQWYSDIDRTQLYDFTAPVTRSFTLWARWVEDGCVHVSDNAQATNCEDPNTCTKCSTILDVASTHEFHSYVHLDSRKLVTTCSLCMYYNEKNLELGDFIIEFPDGPIEIDDNSNEVPGNTRAFDLDLVLYVPVEGGGTIPVSVDVKITYSTAGGPNGQLSLVVLGQTIPVSFSNNVFSHTVIINDFGARISIPLSISIANNNISSIIIGEVLITPQP